MTGLATSTISKVENGRMSLTYDKLQQLAKGLSIDLVDLFGAGKGAIAPATATARRSIGRSGDGVVLPTQCYEYRFLNADLAAKLMVPLVGEAKARTLQEFGEMIRHEGEEFLFVLEGSIVVHTEYYAPAVLQAGDHLYIDSQMGHAYLKGSDAKCRALVVCTGTRTEEIERAIQAPELERRTRDGLRDGMRDKGRGKGRLRAKPAKTRK